MSDDDDLNTMFRISGSINARYRRHQLIAAGALLATVALISGLGAVGLVVAGTALKLWAGVSLVKAATVGLAAGAAVGLPFAAKRAMRPMESLRESLKRQFPNVRALD